MRLTCLPACSLPRSRPRWISGSYRSTFLSPPPLPLSCLPFLSLTLPPPPLPLLCLAPSPPHGSLPHYLTLPLEQLPSTLIFKLRTESVEALRAGMDQHMEVADVSDDDGGGGGRTPLYLSRRQLAALRRQRLEHWKISLWHSRCLLGAFSVGSSG